MNKDFFKTWITYSFLLMVLLSVTIFFWDFYSGADTQGFGVIEPYYGIGMFYIYMISFFSSLIVLYAIIKSEVFGMGFYMWLPYAVIGFFVEAYFELDLLISIWAVLGYSAFGLITGLSADICFKLLNENTKIKKSFIAGISGTFMSFVYFVLVVIALGFFYKSGWGAGSFTEPGSFLGVAYFCLPWMLINAFFGGFTAYCLNQVPKDL
jgi:hypothetical protein